MGTIRKYPFFARYQGAASDYIIRMRGGGASPAPARANHSGSAPPEAPSPRCP